MLEMLKSFYQRDTTDLLCFDDWPDLQSIIKKIKKIIKEIKNYEFW